jgi:hypothetical protein
MVCVAMSLAGCGHSSSGSGWLASDDNRVVYAEWKDLPDGSVRGTGSMLEVQPAAADPYTLASHQLTVTGSKKGTALDLSVNVDATKAHWMGSVDQNTVVLTIPDVSGDATITFRRADSKAYTTATNGLRALMKTQATEAQQRGALISARYAEVNAAASARQHATAAATAEETRQNMEIDTANNAVRAALAKLDVDVKAMPQTKYDPNTYFRPVDGAYQDLRAAAVNEQNDLALKDCARLAADAAIVTQKLGALTSAKSAFDIGVTTINDQTALVKGDITAAENASSGSSVAQSQNPQGQPSTPLISPTDVGLATGTASQRLVDRGVALLAAVQKAEAAVTDGTTLNGTEARTAAACTGAAPALPEPAPPVSTPAPAAPTP